MTEQTADYTVRLTSEMDQLSEHAAGFAGVVARYHRELVAGGIERSQAAGLTAGFAALYWQRQWFGDGGGEVIAIIDHDNDD